METFRPEQIVCAARALRHLTRAAGRVDEPGDLERLLELAHPGRGEVPLGPLDWLALAASGEGLRPVVVEADVAGALERLDRGIPLLTALPDGAGAGRETRWLTLLGRRGRNVVVAEQTEEADDTERAVPASTLEVELGLAPGATLRWLLAEAVSQAGAAESPGTGHPAPLARLARLLRPDRGELIAVAVFAVTIGVLLLATPIAVQALVNFVAQGGAVPPLIVVAALLFLGLGFAGVLSALQAWIVEVLQRRIFVRMVADLAARLPRVTADVYDRKYGPELVNRFFDVVTIQKVGSALLLDGLSILLSVTVGLVVLAFYHPLLLAFDIVLLAVIALIVVGPARRGVRTAIEESQAKYDVVAWLEEIARSPLVFKSSGVLQWVFERSDRLTHAWVERRKSHFRVLFGQVLGAIGLQVAASTVLLGIGGLLVIQGSLTLGQLVAAELIVTLVVSSVAKLGKHIEGFYDLMAATDKVGHLLDLPLEPRIGEYHVLPVTARGASLELRSVSYWRGGESKLLRGLDLRVEAGERIGVRGPSGAGKSTLLELLWGLRRPDRGVIRVDGRDVRELSLDSLRRTVGLAARVEAVEGSVRDNVRLARAFVSDADVRDALRRVDLLEELEDLPDGLDTRLNANGRPLSDGQLQRLQLARTLAARPRLLLVSDVLTQLSGDNRQLVLDSLFDPDAPWTLVVVSNEPDVLERCDRHLALPTREVRELALDLPPGS